MDQTNEFEDGSQSGYAAHAHWCPHCEDHVKPFNLASAEKPINPKSNICSDCTNSNENWLCLDCHQVFCGRFAKGHMLAHNEATGHCVAAGFNDLSFWCYECETYLYHRTIPRLYTAYAMLHMLKFDEAPVDGPLPSAQPTSSSVPAAAVSSQQSTAGVAAAALSQQTIPEVDEEGNSQMTDPSDEFDNAPSRSASTISYSQANSSQQAPSRAVSTAPPTSVTAPVAGLSAAQMQHPLIQKILGAIYGNALGDAFGLSTEFMDRAGVAQFYGAEYNPVTGKGSIPFPNYIKTRHSARWQTGDWTDDSDQMILILECILEGYSGANAASLPGSGVIDPKLFASKLKSWVRKGFPELGDQGGLGLGALTHSVVTHPEFLSNPHSAARKVWEEGGRKNAANGALMRTSITGVFEYQSLPDVHANTKAMARVTHADSRCVASCILMTSLMSAILSGSDVSTPAKIEALISQTLAKTKESVPELESEGHTAVFDEHVAMTKLEEMKFDESHGIGYTLKCLAAGMFGLRSQENFIVTMTRLVREAGDADTNGAVCGALVGAKLGYDGLPAAWLNAMPNKAWLDKKVVDLIKLMLARFEYQQSRAGSSAASSSVKSA